MTDDEEKQVVEETKGKSHPETVSWTQYVGLKEKFSKVETELTGKVQALEEQLKATASTEEFNRVKRELEEAKTKLQATSDELKSFKDKSLEEKRVILRKKGIPEDQVIAMSEEALIATAKVLGDFKPKPDFSGGGGSTELKGSPMELAQRAYSKEK